MKSLNIIFFILATMGAESHCLAADVTILVSDITGKPVKDAVVSFTPKGGATLSATDLEGSFVMAQHDIAFEPHVLVVPKGAIVAFPNRDNVSHHVYSFSAAHKFQIPLYGHDTTRTQKFDQVGTVALGCNIHDQMSGYIRVVDTPYVAKTDALGLAHLTRLPDTEGTLVIWQEQMIAPNNELIKTIDTTTLASHLTVTVKLHPKHLTESAY